MKRLKRITKQSEFYVFLIIIALSIVIQIRSGQFYTNNNIVDITRSMIVPLIYALCAFLAFISTGPDVSFPLVAALSAYLAIRITYATGYNGPWILVYLIGMVFGGIMGALNGFIIVRYKFPSLIVTLGTSSIFSGLLLGAFEAQRMDLPENLANYGSSVLLRVKNPVTGLGAALPMTFLIVVVLYIVAYLLLNYTMVGRGVFAIGGDEISAERAGFNVKGIRFGIFVINGMLAAIAGLTYAVRVCRSRDERHRGHHPGGHPDERRCGYIKRMCSRYIASDHGDQQSDPSGCRCQLAEGVHRRDHHYRYSSIRDAESWRNQTR